MKRQDYLKRLAIKQYGTGNHPKPSLDVFNDVQLEEIERIYQQLGGILPEIPFRFGGYDIELKDVIIELDEGEHFNRYRKSTLDSSIYQDFRNFDVKNYKKFCDGYEHKCRRYGGLWSNSSCEKMFDLTTNSEFEDIGAPRWKQRAFYDFIKDMYSVVSGIPIIMIYIYYRYASNTIDGLIANEDSRKLQEYITMRYQLVH